MAIPGDAIPLVAWAAALAPGTPATFEKMELGRVRLLPGAAYEAAMASAGADEEAARDVQALLSRAKWEREQRITVPVEMAWHLFGPKIIRGPIYIHPSACFELWAERYYERWTLERRARQSDHLPD